ncbi:hypothetical protein [Luteolibacter sp. AS25]|uniref:hypothetical protein n=1 Tax=Luteolibacter sp. AS25 TaxID=3135776 RepID=UPI00398AE6BB
MNSRVGKSVWASIAIDEVAEDSESVGFMTHLVRMALALVLLPFSWVTTWAFLSRFSHATVEQGFWQSPQFWYFTIGSLVMLGWFWSRLGQSIFLYIYVFGHELTHAAFVKCFGGKILEMKWGAEGGYVTTDKSNWVISLSPYFVPFWTLMSVVVHVLTGFFFEYSATMNLFFYGVVGATWTFHLAWTLWMIPKDQPDLQDNGTFLSLVLIYFGNLLVLITLVCLASPSPLESLEGFGNAWLRTATIWVHNSIDWLTGFAELVLR